MAEGMAEYEGSIGPLKRLLFGELLAGLPATATSQNPAQLLELGIGTGPNLRYYSDFYGLNAEEGGSTSSGASSSSSSKRGSALDAPAGPPLHIVGLDPNPFMRPYLEQGMQSVGWPQQRLTWMEGSAEALPLPDECMDAVVCTLVLCSVSDVEAAVREAGRVLKPGGALLFIEHTAAQGQPLLLASQRLLNPLQRLLADNCHLTRDPLPVIEACPAFSGGVEWRRLSVDGASLISPHVAGIARRQA